MFGFRYVFMFQVDHKFSPPDIDHKEVELKKRLSYQKFTGAYKPY